MLKLPFHFLARYVKARDAQPSFIAESTAFEDMVIRIVRYGFMNFPVKTIRVFLSRQFAYPFLKWRMFRSGYFSFPAQLQEKVLEQVCFSRRFDVDMSPKMLYADWCLCFVLQGSTTTTGLWIRHNPDREPDVVIYYVHGMRPIIRI